MAINLNFLGTGGIIEGDLGAAIINVNTDPIFGNFNGTTSSLSSALADHDDIFAGNGGCFAAWIYPKGIGEGTYGRIINKGGTLLYISGLSNGFATLKSSTDFNTTNGEWYTASSVIPMDSWSHVAIVYNASATTNDPVMYINGVSVNVIEGETPVGSYDDASSTLYIGNNSGGGGGSRTWDGYIMDVKIYKNVAVTATNVAKMASKINVDKDAPDMPTSGLQGWYPLTADDDDDSGEGNNLTAENMGSIVYDAFSVNVHDNTTVTTGDVTVTQGKLEGLSLTSATYNGTSDKVRLDNQLVTDSFTISCWAYNDNGSSRTIFEKYNAGSAPSLEGSTTAWKFYMNNSDYIAFTFTASKWMHIICTYDGVADKQRLYVDGVLIGENTSVSLDDFTSLNVGARFLSASWSRFFDGKLRDFRVYTHPVDDAMAASLYSGTYNVTPDSAWIKFDDISGDPADSSTNADTATLVHEDSVIAAYGDGTLDLGTLTIASGGTYSATSGTTTITDRIPGDKSLENNGTFTHNKGTVLFNSTGDQLLQMAGTGNLYNFTINKSDSDVAFVGNHTFENNLDVTMAADHTARSNNASETVTVYGNTYLTTGKLGESTQWTGTNNWGMLTVNSGEFILSTGTNNFTGIRNVGGTISQS